MLLQMFDRMVFATTKKLGQISTRHELPNYGAPPNHAFWVRFTSVCKLLIYSKHEVLVTKVRVARERQSSLIRKDNAYDTERVGLR